MSRRSSIYKGIVSHHDDDKPLTKDRSGDMPGSRAALAAQLGVVRGSKRLARGISGDGLGVRTKKRLAADIIGNAERGNR